MNWEDNWAPLTGAFVFFLYDVLTFVRTFSVKNSLFFFMLTLYLHLRFLRPKKVALDNSSWMSIISFYWSHFSILSKIQSLLSKLPSCDLWLSPQLPSSLFTAKLLEWMLPIILISFISLPLIFLVCKCLSFYCLNVSSDFPVTKFSGPVAWWWLFVVLPVLAYSHDVSCNIPRHVFIFHSVFYGC